jgi:hypothetical protein
MTTATMRSTVTRSRDLFDQCQSSDDEPAAEAMGNTAVVHACMRAFELAVSSRNEGLRACAWHVPPQLRARRGGGRVRLSRGECGAQLVLPLCSLGNALPCGSALWGDHQTRIQEPRLGAPTTAA